MACPFLRDLYPLVGQLLSYPGSDFSVLVGRTQERLLEFGLETSDPFEEFQLKTGELSLKKLQEMYTRFFDLSPVCIPYLSVHLFGEENLKRSRLMVALREKYQEWDFEPGRELPDHLSPVLRAAPYFEEEEWREFLELCLKPALEKMRDSLVSTGNPYALLIECLWSLTRTETLLEISYA